MSSAGYRSSALIIRPLSSRPRSSSGDLKRGVVEETRRAACARGSRAALCVVGGSLMVWKLDVEGEAEGLNRALSRDGKQIRYNVEERDGESSLFISRNSSFDVTAHCSPPQLVFSSLLFHTSFHMSSFLHSASRLLLFFSLLIMKHRRLCRNETASETIFASRKRLLVNVISKEGTGGNLFMHFLRSIMRFLIVTNFILFCTLNLNYFPILFTFISAFYFFQC